MAYQIEKNRAQRSRQEKVYPFAEMEVGDAFCRGKFIVGKERLRASRHLRIYAHLWKERNGHHDWRFSVRVGGAARDEVWCWRVM